MLRRLISAFILTFVSTATVLGQDAAEQALIDCHTARAIEAQCHFLRYFELSVDHDIEPNVLRPLWFTGAHEAGRIDDEEYLEAYNKLADMGEQRAAGIDCANEAAAAPYILKLRGQIPVLIYADLIIAVDGGGLSDERMRAARACEAMISPFYGENWQSFSEYARRQAQYFPSGSFVHKLADAGDSVRYELSDMPGQFELLEKIGTVNLVFAVNMEGEVRAMTWGLRAREALADGSVTILANPTKLESSLTTDYTYMRSQEWLDGADIFTGLPL